MPKMKYWTGSAWVILDANNANAVPWSGITSKPATLSGYGITDAYTKTQCDTYYLPAASNAVSATKLYTARTINGVAFDGTANITITASVSSVAWSAITSTPTTLVGYGITDAAPLSHVGSGGTSHAIATDTVNGFISAADKTKLDGIATSADNVTSSATNGNITINGTQ